MNFTIENIGANVTKLTFLNGYALFSYETLVAIKIKGRTVVTDTKYSVTTTKHINKYSDAYMADKASPTMLQEILSQHITNEHIKKFDKQVLGVH